MEPPPITSSEPRTSSMRMMVSEVWNTTCRAQVLAGRPAAPPRRQRSARPLVVRRHLEHAGRDEPCRLGVDVDPALASMLDGTAVVWGRYTLAWIAGQSTRSSVACTPSPLGVADGSCRAGGRRASSTGYSRGSDTSRRTTGLDDRGPEVVELGTQQHVAAPRTEDDQVGRSS